MNKQLILNVIRHDGYAMKFYSAIDGLTFSEVKYFIKKFPCSWIEIN